MIIQLHLFEKLITNFLDFLKHDQVPIYYNFFWYIDLNDLQENGQPDCGFGSYIDDLDFLKFIKTTQSSLLPIHVEEISNLITGISDCYDQKDLPVCFYLQKNRLAFLLKVLIKKLYKAKIQALEIKEFNYWTINQIDRYSYEKEWLSPVLENAKADIFRLKMISESKRIFEKKDIATLALFFKLMVLNLEENHPRGSAWLL